MRWPARAAIAGLSLLLGLASEPLHAQGPEVIRLENRDGQVRAVRVRWERGFAAAWIGSLTAAGWEIAASGDSAVARHADGHRISLRAGTPFAVRDGLVVQLADSPYLADQALFVPVQVLAELAEAAPRAGPGPSQPDPGPEGAPLIVIDAGHGGRDLGTIGYRGTREKDVTLALAHVLAETLEGLGYEARLTRASDEFIPVWERGPLATGWKGARPGVLVSLHVNANPHSRQVRGLETYFLADARTEHERRLAELENTSFDDGALPGEDLSVILSELRNLDHQRWSARLAELVHTELRSVHPGPDLGVRQAPLAVLTNALMPSVLVELGYVTNAAEEELLNRPDFHADVASSLARALAAFLQTYPPRGAEVMGGRPL